MFVEMVMNDADSTIGHLYGCQLLATLTNGTIGDGEEDLYGAWIRGRIDAGTINGDLLAAKYIVDGNGGTVAGDIYGTLIDVDLEGAMTSIGGSVYGTYISIDADENPTGLVYMHYLKENSGVDFGYYQDGTAQNLFGGTLKIKESAAANADTAAYGQIWVKNDAPNTLWFTDDGGADVQLGTGGAFTSRCSVYLSTPQTITKNTLTVIAFDTERFDGDGEWDVGNYKFVVGTTGYYQVNAQARISPLEAITKVIDIAVHVDDVEVAYGITYVVADTVAEIASVSKLIYCAAGEEIKFKVFHNSNVNEVLYSEINWTCATIHRVS